MVTTQAAPDVERNFFFRLARLGMLPQLLQR